MKKKEPKHYHYQLLTLTEQLFEMISNIEFLKQSKSYGQDDLGFASQIRNTVAKIQITPDFTIAHSDYESLTVSDRYRNYLEESSCENQDLYLASRLRQYLYAIFNGDLKPKRSIARKNNAFSNNPNSSSEIVNNTNSWHKTKFFNRLVQLNHGRGYKDYGWVVVIKGTESWQVSKNGLTIFIDPQQNFSNPDLIQIGQTVSITIPSNLVERDFYIAVGDAGSTSNFKNSLGSTIAQLYFNVGSEAALLLLDDLTRQLNALEISFDFKIPYSETDFDRLDAPLLEFMSSDWSKVQEIVKNVYAKNKASFAPLVPFFCKQLEAGLGLAEKPYTKSNVDLGNIGFKYCQIIAQAIIKASKEYHIVNIDKLDLIMSYLSKAKINWEHLYLNAESTINYSIL